MTRKIKKFSGTSLDNKIPKDADFKKEYQRKFVELCHFFKLDPLKFKKLDETPWRELSFKLMEHLVPGFQRNKSGRKQEKTPLDDYLITWEIEIPLDFYKLDSDGKDIPGTNGKIKEEIKKVSKIRGLSEGSIRAARNRNKKRMRDGTINDVYNEIYSE